MTDPFYGVTVQTTIQGDSYNFRAVDGEEFAKLMKTLAEHGDEITENFSAFKQVVVAKGVNTSPKPVPAQRSPGGRAPDTKPGDVPSCKHGPMKDLASKNYKHRYYCTLETDNYKEKCKALD